VKYQCESKIVTLDSVLEDVQCFNW